MESLKDKKLLILGGSGFIGSHLADKAISYGCKVDTISRKKITEKTKNNKVNYINLDLANLDQVRKIKKLDYDYVVNLSGYIDHSNFSNNGQSIVDTHFTSIMIIIEKLLNSNLKKFIQIGSSDEYGNSFSPQLETMRENPISPYSFSKTATNHFLQMLHKTENFPCVILRLFLVYGPRQSLDRFIPQVIQGCLDDKKFDTTIGKQIRDFCYIDDVIDAILISLSNESVNGELINIASGNPIELKTIINLIPNIIKLGTPNLGGLKLKKIENSSLYANIEKAKKILNWAPQIDIESGIRKTIKYYSNIKELKTII